MNKGIIIILVIVIIVALGVGGYFLFKKPSTSISAGTDSQSSDKVTSSDPQIQKRIDSIYNTPAWMDQIKTKAAANGVSINQQILDDAKWCVSTGNC